MVFFKQAAQWARLFFWPKGGWQRSFRYLMLRMMRMRSSNYALSIGFSAGVFISFTPLLGFHFLLAALIAWILRGNIIASALGTVFGNPLTFPFIWAGDYVIGMWILHGEFLSWNNVSVPQDFGEVAKAFYPLLIGSIPLGATIAALNYFIVYYIIQAYRQADDDDQIGR